MCNLPAIAIKTCKWSKKVASVLWLCVATQATVTAVEITLSQHSTVVFTKITVLLEQNVIGHVMWMTVLCPVLTLTAEQRNKIGRIEEEVNYEITAVFLGSSSYCRQGVNILG